LNQENRDSFCASCHTQPETRYYEQSTATAPTTLASFHATKGVRCIDCHSGGGAFGRIEGLEQGSQDLLSYYSGRYHNPAITTNKLSDDSCTKCHAEVYYGADFNNHFHRFLLQWQSRDPNAAGCVDCHTGHPPAGADQQFMVESTFTPVCQRCHATLGGGE
ncbi:MAG: cytochrome c3 family protein, partial [Rudaea sp.]